MSVMKKVMGLLIETDEAPADPKKTQSVNAPGGASLDDDLKALDAQIAGIAQGKSPGKVMTVEKLVEGQPGPNLPDIQARAPSIDAGGQPAKRDAALPTRAPDGSIDCSGVYAQAGVSPVVFGAENALELIASLPGELPLESKRSSLKTMLAAMGKQVGVTPEMVVADSARKIAALSTLKESFDRQVKEFTDGTQNQIAQYEQKIAEARKSLEVVAARQKDIHGMCDAEIDRLDDVAEYLTLDAGPSKFANIPGIPPLPGS